MNLALISAIPFALTLVLLVTATRVPKAILVWGITLMVALLFGALVGYVDATRSGEALTFSIPWITSLKLSYSIYLDSLALLFALLVTGIGALIALYAGYYFEKSADLIRFYQLLLIFMGGMLGLVMAGNLFTLFIGWEITSISSFFLIGFKGDNPEARRGALQALVITAGGGLALLLGLALLGSAVGSFEWVDILNQRELLQHHPFFSAIAIFIFIGCFSKSAQFPVHFWLPGAMTAPTPASAYLHSATMVKAGIYLLLRLYPVMGESLIWQNTLIPIGLITMAIGAFFALRNTDLKACLAYSTVSQLGAFVALIGLPHGEGLVAALVGIVAHAMYKGALFLIAGTVEHSVGSRDLSDLGGLGKSLRPLALITVLAAASMAGLPPLLGFVAKEGMLEAFLHGSSNFAVGVVTLSALLTVTMAAVLVWDVFFRPRSAALQHHEEAHGHEHHLHLPGWGLQISPAVMAAGSILGGLLLTPLIQPLVQPYLGESSLKLWHGFNTAFLLSLIAVGGGLMIFGLRRQWQGWNLPTLPRGRDLYDGVIRGVEKVADVLLLSQGGKLRYYLAAIIVTVILLMATAGLSGLHFASLSIQMNSSADFLKATLLILTIGATFASILFKRHLIAALALGVAGYSVGGLFLLEPAPDVALVQFLVETMGTVLVMIMLGKISANERQQVIKNLWGQTRAGVFRDALIATLVGVGVGLFSLAAVLNRPTRISITEWHISHAEKAVGATDIVAAIVTDFRGMDTIIEITVFGMAALGVLTLLSTPEPGRTIQFMAGQVLQRLRSRGTASTAPTAAEKELADPAIQREIAALLAERSVSILSSPMTRAAANLLLPFALLVSISHIAYGAGAPGDGFTAGVVSGLGIAVWYVVFGYDQAKRRLRWLHPVRLIGAGIGLAILNAVVPLLFGQPFLVTTQFKELVLPAGLHLTSTSFFELGIFLTVLGSTALILETIAHPQEVEAL